ncbi:MAG TPA: hypothetical protein VNU66_00935, partial [Mycobacteriales bacterium]|nr:hypothetical protein [Mycobacteriales bacterium]
PGLPGPWGPPPGQPWDAWQQPWGAPPPDPAAVRRRRRRAVAALVSVVGLLVAALVVDSVVEDRRQERVRAEVAALLPGLVAFVEQERGLPFLEEVDVEVLDDDAFLEALYEDDGDTAPEPPGDSEATLRALGLVEEGTDLDEEVGEALDEGVVGFYDPRDERLVVRGREVDAFVELVVVHELVHALQDQHFDIDRPDLLEADDERSTAFTALLEGDAVRVETAWYLAQSPERQAEVDALGGGELAGTGDVVEALIGFPYYAGPGYVEALLAEGGQQALDAAFAEPPTTTGEVLAPDRVEPAPAPPAPEPGGDVVDEGVLGVLGLALLTGADPLDLDDALLGWRADRYATAQDGGSLCTTAHVVAEDPAALRTALEEAGVETGDGPGGTVLLRSCA